MTRLFGMLLIMAAGLVIGKGRAEQLWGKARAFGEAADIISMLAAELEARRPLRGSCLELSRLEGKTGEFFRVLALYLESLGEKGIGHLWAEAARCVFGGVLSRNELSGFENFGAVISSGQAVEQRAGHRSAELRRLKEKAEERASLDGRMYTGLGVALGAAVSIMLF